MFFAIFVSIVITYLLISFIFHQKYLALRCENGYNKYKYNKPNFFYGIKFLLAKFLVTLEQRKQKKLNRNTKYSSDFSQVLLCDSNEASLEKAQNLTELGEQANDAVAFQGSDDKGNQLLVRFARRQKHLAEIWLLLRMVDQKTHQVTIYCHPEHPNGIVTGCFENVWSAKGLTCEMNEPMKRWRISYNGFMRRGARSDMANVDDNLIHMKFEFYWTSFSEPFYFNHDMNADLVADALAREPWSAAFFDELKAGHETRYEQWGQMTGSVHLDNEEEINMTLAGMRDHCFGKRDWKKYARYTANMGYCDDGTFFHLGAVCMPASTTHLLYGYVGHKDGSLTAVNQTSLNLALLGDIKQSPKVFTFNFQAGKEQYSFRGIVDDEVSVRNGSQWESHSFLRFISFQLNNSPGTGFSEFEYRNEKRDCHFNAAIPISPLPHLDERDLDEFERAHLVVPLSHKISLCKSMVGGKACQMAQLIGLQEKFTIPTAICVTSKAFRSFVKSNQMESDIEILKETLLSNINQGLWQEKASELRAKIENGQMSIELTTKIVHQLDRVFGQWRNIDFAVRSSASDEDGCLTSFAGQMSTVLNVKSSENVLKAVRKVWASAFSNECLVYRRQNGLPLTVDVCVLIQQMVQADIAGVMFTADPLSGHPGRIVVNACRGLGEGVVDGSVKPFEFEATKTYSGKVKHVICKGVSEDDPIQIFMKKIHKLVEIGVQIEHYSLAHRDIEWAIKNDEIYILQSRPITNLNSDSDFALIHEFDTRAGGKNEYSTKHNIGEVIGGVSSPLGLSIAVNAVDKALQYQLSTNGLNEFIHPNFYQTLLIFANQVAIKMTQTMYKDPLVAEKRQISELCVLGKTLEDSNLDEILKPIHQNCSKFDKFVHFLHVLKMMYSAYNRRNEFLTKYKDVEFKLAPHESSAPQILAKIEQLLPSLCHVWTIHMAMSGYSGFWYHMIVKVIVKDRTTFTPTMYSDIAKLYASCSDVESADIPAALQELSEEILQRIDAKYFASMTIEEASNWLASSDSGLARDRFKRFQQMHGHRCLREIDLRAKSWGEDSLGLIEIIQSLVGAGHVSKRNGVTSVEDAVNKLSIKPSTIEKKFLSWAVTKARDAVGYREQTKSLSIKVTNALRVGYRKMGDVLTKTGKLPDQDLIYYLTHYELRQLVNSSSNASLVHKAQRRRKIEKRQEAVVLPEIIVGYPKNVAFEESSETFTIIEGTSVKGTPVSSGKINGTVRVCKTLEEAKFIKAGEILVTHSTDIAWSVYFPIISGIITELGGLLSHGAVVARECGIPCLVSATNATKLLKTGDRILLDCQTGVAMRTE